ncbi:MAG: CHAT domain-containing protein [Chitinophagales bacterium]|jgi:CHAT domain-containing protein|nr:CHAT domain-containing protein [Chitinophagales bacterium]
MKFHAPSFLILLLLSHFALAQKGEQEIFCAIEKADSLFDKNRNLEGLEVLLRCKQRQQQDSLSLTFAQLYYKIGKGYYYADFNDSALYYFNKTLQRQKLLLGNDHKDTQYTRYVIVLAHESMRNYRTAMPLIEDLINIEEHKKTPNDTTLANYYLLLSGIACGLGDAEKTERYANKSLRFYECYSQYLAANCYVAKGLAHAQTETHEKALPNYLIAQEMYKQCHDIPAYMHCVSLLGITYRKLKQPYIALQYLQEAIKYNQSNPNFSFNLAGDWANVAIVKKDLGLYDEAIAALNTSKQIYQIHHLSNNMNNASYYDNIGDVFFLQGKDTASLEAYQKSMNYLLTFNYQKLDDNPSIHNASIENPLLLFNIMFSKAQTFYHIAKQHNNEQALDAAYNTCLSIDTLITHIQQNIQSDESVIAFNQKIAKFYELAIKVTIIQKPEQAFLFAEKGKAFVLRKFLQNIQALQLANIPNSIISEDQNFINRIAHIENLIAQHPHNTSLQDSLFKLYNQRQDFLIQLENNYPNYFQLKYANQIPSVDKIKQLLVPHQALVSYYIGNESYYIFVLTQNSFKYYEFPKENDFSSCLNDFLIATQQMLPTNEYPILAHYWYERLLKKVISTLPTDVNRLIIIPDAELGYIPFDILVEHPPEQWHNNTKIPAWQNIAMPLVLKRFAVSYNYTIMQLIDAQDSIQVANFKTVSFGLDYKDPQLLAELNNDLQTETSTTRSSLGQLPHAPVEALNIADLMKGEAYLNKQATLSNFWKVSQKYSIIHLAMHGIIDDDNPLNSKLAFNKDINKAPCYLTAADLYGQQLKATMVVLSACNSGNGTLKRSEGIMSLARAFAFAGCHSLVMSLWNLSDEPTSVIMQNFYHHLKLGKPKDIALQNAKIDYFTQQKFNTRYPVNWGSFVLVGNIHAIEEKNNWGFDAVLIVAVLVLPTILYIHKQRK